MSTFFPAFPVGGVILIAFFLVLNTVAQGQQLDGVQLCGTEEPAQNLLPPSESLDHCFTVQTIFDNCTKIWLRVNIHFFLDDNCEGTLDPLGNETISPEKAYEVAESLINSANDRLENNREQWNQVPWGVLLDQTRYCVPFRYLLSGVYVHCSTTATNTSASQLNSFFQANFGVNVSSEYNCYIAEYVGSSTGVAALSGNRLAVENFAPGNFNHEMGHCLNLEHSWAEDFVSDTPEIRFDYDFNCDGDVDDTFSSPGIGKEKDRQCYVYFYDTHFPLPPPIDYNGDGVVDIQDPCDPDLPCLPYPCCQWEYNNNNIMAYSSYIDCCSAYTKGQILRALDHLSTETVCEFIEDITDTCHPPKANAAILPFENADDCNYCLHFEHSMNETWYLLEFLEGANLVHSTGWVNEQVGVYCISQSVKFPNQYDNGFQGGHTYTAKLTVENDCGDAETRELAFTLPVLSCVSDVPPFDFKDLAPNPFLNNFTYEYETSETGNLKIWLISLSDRNNAELIAEETDLQPGVYQQTKSTVALQSGVYALVAQFNGGIYSINLVKS